MGRISASSPLAFGLTPSLLPHSSSPSALSRCFPSPTPLSCRHPVPRMSSLDALRALPDAKVHPSLLLDSSTTTLTTSAPIPKGAALLDLAAPLILSSANSTTALSPAAAALAPPAALAAMLVQARADGSASPYASLVQDLPQRMNQPFLWSAAELAWLAGSAIQERATTVRKGIEEEWREDVQALCSSECGVEDYLWAQSVVASRAVVLGKAFPLAIAPGMELLSHARAGDSGSVQAIEGGGGFFSKPRFLLCATREIAAGEAPHMVFGDDGVGAGDFLLDHGFVAEGAGTVVEVGFSLAPLDPFYEDKVDILEFNEEVEAPVFPLTSVSTRGLWSPPDHLEPFVRLVCLGVTDAFLLEAVFRNEVYGFMELPVSLTNEEAMCNAIIAACEDVLDGYTGEIPGSEEYTGDPVRATRAQAARDIVEGEKNVLQAAIAHYQKQLENLDTKEYYQERRLKALDLLRPLDESEIVDADAGRRMSQAFDENY